jgi:hypothetical protein
MRDEVSPGVSDRNVLRLTNLRRLFFGCRNDLSGIVECDHDDLLLFLAVIEAVCNRDEDCILKESP